MAAGFTLKVTKDFDHKAFDALKKLTGDSKRVVNVGVGPGKREPDGTPLAMIGAVQEFGAPELGIPERPWLRPAITDNRAEYTALNRINLVKLMKGEITYDDALGQLGAMAVGNVVKQIKTADYTPLKASTLAARARRNTGAYNKALARKREKMIAAGQTPPPTGRPLVDTGNFWQSITFSIGPRDD